MKPLSYYMHKSMLPLKDGRPVIDHIVDYLFSYGFEPIIALSKGNHAEQVMKHLGPKFEYSITNEPQGTAGEVYHARDLLGGKPFLVYYGDTITDLNIHRLTSMHTPQNIATLTAFRGAKTEYGIIEGEFGRGRVSALREKGEVDYLTVLPVFYCEPRIIPFCKSVVPGMPNDFMSQLFPFLLEEGHQLGMYVHRGVYKDIGRLTDYAKEAGLE